MVLQGAQAAILGFDVTHRETMDICDYWVREIRNSNADCAVVAVGNKIDLSDRREISTEEARAHFEEKGVPYFETSAKTGEGVNELFEAVTQMTICRNNENEEGTDVGEAQTPEDGKCIIC